MSTSDFLVIDVDTHWTEASDTWTSRAPARFRDRVPRVEDVDGRKMWVFDGHVLGQTSGSSGVRRDGTKCEDQDFFNFDFDDVIEASYDVKARLALMDKQGIWAQIVYPNVVGFGGQGISDNVEGELRTIAALLWNDAMAEIQAESSDRLLPMALVPWWDLDTALAEIERVKSFGLRGLNLTADTQAQGLPDLGDRYWDPMWDAIEGSRLSINFHIGSSATQQNYYGSTPWPSLADDAKYVVGSAIIHMSNARVIGNLMMAGVFERFPSLTMVSVESGLGWIPFYLENLEHHLLEGAPATRAKLSLTPMEYFKRNVMGTFWYERTDLAHSIRYLGADNCMFETDFPHPTCLYPRPIEHIRESLAEFDEATIHKLLYSNAARVYDIEGPPPGHGA
jgi:predicted TIM-barrel fold metal-dependent hydrolase